MTLTCGLGAVAGSGQGKVSFVLTLITEAVPCEMVSTHKLTRTAAGTEYRH